jgi:hypothetical protein
VTGESLRDRECRLQSVPEQQIAISFPTDESPTDSMTQSRTQSAWRVRCSTLNRSSAQAPDATTWSQQLAIATQEVL